MKNFKKIITTILAAVLFISAPSLQVNAANVSPKERLETNLVAQNSSDYATTREAFSALTAQEKATALQRSNHDLQSLSSDVATIAKYDSWEFYTRSAPELIELQMDTDMVSLVGYCDGDQTDDLEITIRSTSGKFEEAIPFKADGVLRSYYLKFPKGEYKIYIMGDVNIKKINASAYFSVGAN